MAITRSLTLLVLPEGISEGRLFVSAENIAFADRNKYMGDADFVDLPMPNSGITGFPEDGGLLAKVYARQRWAEHGGATQEEVPWGVPPDWDGGACKSNPHHNLMSGDGVEREIACGCSTWSGHVGG